MAFVAATLVSSPLSSELAFIGQVALKPCWRDCATLRGPDAVEAEAGKNLCKDCSMPRTYEVEQGIAKIRYPWWFGFSLLHHVGKVAPIVSACEALGIHSNQEVILEMRFGISRILSVVQGQQTSSGKGSDGNISSSEDMLGSCMTSSSDPKMKDCSCSPLPWHCPLNDSFKGDAMSEVLSHV
eukprot:CAMPEP_0170600910 /NCGR_PEP_ID=MMETSP0224-20130122/17580_1 /TAXON_ID=285029 /ORGANISM="Togula jolla, Strain CCCM 725" /LENGTH=182 /DNA_ID=CAMNT_0010925655 /DNA_START=246 /DNA_END=795 /DNA_ORIENTATION=-